MTRPWELHCVECNHVYPPMDVRYRCSCGGTLDVIHTSSPDASRDLLRSRRAEERGVNCSGVWRYREWVLPLSPDEIVTRCEGNTNLYQSRRLASYCGLDSITLKHEGENPTGSFKDRGMTVAVSMAVALGAKAVACASTGNTSASLASYAATADLPAFVFVPSGHVAYGKLSQALAFGATTIQIDGDFDDTMRLVQQTCDKYGIYLVNSINPFRIEGQKAIVFELLQQLDFEVPDWIVLPGGNLGNSSAFAKGLIEWHDAGMIDRLPRLAVIQARGANPLARAFASGADVQPVANAETVATAIRIGDPVSWRKCLRGIKTCRGVVTDVDDNAIMDAKAVVDASGIGAEPASCATVAGIRRLVQDGIIRSEDKVCGILTGNILKDPDAIINYHTGTMDGIQQTRANPPQAGEDSLREMVEKVLARN